VNSKSRLIAGLVIGITLSACGETPAPDVATAQDDPDQKQPNILFIVADDLGYTDLGVYGSEIETPNLDKLATDGVMFKNFYAAPTCSPTRAMLLSGVDNHPAGMGSMYREISPNQVGQRGYEEHLHSRVATIAEVLGDAGYHTYMTGKWHLGYKDDNSPAARGFERSYASLAGGASHFDMMPMVGPGKAPYREDQEMIDALPDDFYSTQSFTHKMIDYIDSNQADDRPFFGYLAYTAVHWPLQAPQPSIERFQGNYDDGYDVLHTNRIQRLKSLGLIDENVVPYPKLAEVPAWDSLSTEEQQNSARMMEIYAAMTSDIDQYIGELIAYLESIDEFDNTLIVFLSDNGAEGHPMDQSIGAIGRWIEECCDNSYDNMGNADSFLWYGAGWARASTGPWRMFKGFTSEGGIRVPAIMHYPKLNQSGLNTALVSVMDVMPTVLDLVGVEHPDSPYKDRDIVQMTGKSMLPMLHGEAQETHTGDDYIGWELFGKTAIRQGDWKIIQEPAGDFWQSRNPVAENYAWQLFNIAEDPSEMNDLAAKNPGKLADMLQLWEAYAEENQVIIPDQVMGY
jgi:arylsulfatase